MIGITQSYARPLNMQSVIDALNTVCERVFVLNNHPRIDISPVATNCTIVQASCRQFPGYRYDFAGSCGAASFLFADDDTVLDVDDLRALMQFEAAELECEGRPLGCYKLERAHVLAVVAAAKRLGFTSVENSQYADDVIMRWAARPVLVPALRSSRHHSSKGAEASWRALAFKSQREEVNKKMRGWQE